MQYQAFAIARFSIAMTLVKWIQRLNKIYNCFMHCRNSADVDPFAKPLYVFLRDVTRDVSVQHEKHLKMIKITKHCFAISYYVSI